MYTMRTSSSVAMYVTVVKETHPVLWDDSEQRPLMAVLCHFQREGHMMGWMIIFEWICSCTSGSMNEPLTEWFGGFLWKCFMVQPMSCH